MPKMDGRSKMKMLNYSHKLSVTKQCKLLEINRTSIYRPLKEVACDQKLLNLIDEIYLKRPHFGSRGFLKHILRFHGLTYTRYIIRKAMKILGIESIAPKPNLSRPNIQHKKYPYLLKDLKIGVNDVWATDITYIRLNGGFVYLVAVIDWASRKVLSWRLSNTMETQFCKDALEEALEKYPKPKIFNTDQGSQFTSDDFRGLLDEHKIQISMDGKGRWVDNVMVERLWRSLKYENVYPSGYSNIKEAKNGIKEYFEFYNKERCHTALDDKTPNEVYFEHINEKMKPQAA
jgi:putative transposase